MVIFNKRGDIYDILSSLIIGVLVLSLVLYFIFSGSFTEDEINQEVCRESVWVRASAPSVDVGGFTLTDFKSEFPLKCQTQVINIDGDTENAVQVILDVLASGWYMFGNGDFDIFPSKFYGTKSVCIPYARIHFDESVIEDYSDSKKIDLASALDNMYINGKSYKNYLNTVGESFPAFIPGSGREFNYEGSQFLIDEDNQIDVTIKNLRTNAKESGIDFSQVYLPKYIDSSKGDVFIYYGAVVTSDSSDVGNYLPYLFYFQEKQENDPFQELNKQLINGPLWHNINFCENSEGIPA